jgi:hypothetical protein
MAGIFRPGDYLIIVPVSLESVQAGDVIVFDGLDAAGEPDVIVHRVVDVLPEGLVTRGDNNSRLDPAPVTMDNLLGRVTHFERGDKRHRVRGGWWGLQRVRLNRGWRWAVRRSRLVAASLGRQPYGWLRGSRLVCWLWRPAITKIYLAGDGDPVVKYVCGRQTVARWWPDTGRFKCRKPYDLIISRPDCAWKTG